MDMNKVHVGLTIAVVFSMLYVGGLIYYEMAVELENNPDIKEIGGPPVIDDLRLVVVVLVVALFFCLVALKYAKDDCKVEIK